MIFVLIAVLIVIVEYKIKNYMDTNLKLGDKKELLGGKIILNKYYNKGAFLNFMENKKEIVKTISCIFLGILILLFAIMLPKKGNKLIKLGLSLVLGGAISNVSDRYLRGYVVDYFSINCKCKKLKNIVFNLADIAIFLGSFLIFLSSAFSGIIKSGTDKTAE
ncbi:MAG: signal peptidase II [Herbinix sp.]|nr:signal peptidase II [Herbinix sp.]